MSGPLYTGIDIGVDSIKVLSLRRNAANFQVLGAGSARIPAELPGGAEGVTILGSILSRLIKTQHIPVGHIVLGLSGRGSMIRYLSEPIMSPWKLGMLMSFEVGEHLGSASEVAYDYRILELPEFEEGQFSVMLGQAQDKAVMERIDICKAALQRAHEVDLQCLGIFNLYAVSRHCNEEEVVLCLDIGAEETSLSLQRGGSLYFSRSINYGGRRFTNRIKKDLDISFVAAEEIKINSQGIMPEVGDCDLYDEQAERISKSCQAEGGGLCSAVQSSLVFFRNQLLHSSSGQTIRISRDREAIFKPVRAYITGGGSRLKGLKEYLTRQFRYPCEEFDVASVFSECKGSAELALGKPLVNHFATAAGLALGRARVGGMGFNLVTQVEKERRVFWDRTVYIMATGVAALIFLLFSCLVSYRDLRAEREVDQAFRSAVTRARISKDNFSQAKALNLGLQKNVFALEDRRLSASDLLQCLRILRNNTGESFFFTSLAAGNLIVRPTTPVKSAPEINSRRSRRAEAQVNPVSEKLPTRVNVSGRMVEVEGYCLQKDKNTASTFVTNLVLALQKSENGFFAYVEQKLGAPLEHSDSVEGYFFSKNLDKRKSLSGIVFHFKLECWLRDWR